jgi:alpha-tubulin suppressor-like RCC1 family protein
LANKTLLSISVGNTHTCAIASDNNAYCWGSDSNGELGNNTSASPTFLVPVAVDRSGVLSGKTVVSISTGNIYSCALASDSNVYCWGNNGNSQLGNNSTTQSLVPTGIYMSGALATKTIIALSSGNTHSCVIASDNNAYCWGYGLAGELGNNANVTSSVAVAVTKTGVLSGKTILKISSGNTHSCAIASDNNAYCWGYGVKGSLGNNVFGSSSVPVTVYTAGVLSGKTIASITTGLDSTCAIASDGNAYCWGDGNFGQLGNNTSATQSSVPVAVSRSGGLSLVAATSISASYKYACLTGAEYNIYCWGDDTNNQLTSALGTTYIPLVIAGPN